MIHVTRCNQRELLGQRLPHGSSSSSSSGDTYVVHAALVHSHKEMLLRAVDTAHTNSRTASGSTWPATKAHSPQALAPWKGCTSEGAAGPLPRVPKPPWGGVTCISCIVPMVLGPPCSCEGCGPWGTTRGVELCCRTRKAEPCRTSEGILQTYDRHRNVQGL